MTALYFFTYTLGVTAAFFLSPFQSKIRRGLFGRLGVNRRIGRHTASWGERPFWFHVASSGELEQCLPVLDRLKEMRPDIPIFLSYFSPTGQTALKLEKDRRTNRRVPVPWDDSDFSPFDFPWSARRFVQRLNPRAFIAINREVWPGILGACARRKIPRYLFAAFFSRHSRKSAGIYRRWLRAFGYIGTTEPSTGEFLKQEVSDPEGPKIEVVGDPRIERVLARRENNRDFAWKEFFQGQSCLILASLWPQDFESIKQALADNSRRFPEWRLIFVPHETSEAFLEEIAAWFAQNGLKARRWSEWTESPDSTSHLLMDKVGLLAELYLIGKIVFVGGSFRARAHNVLEPAAYALPILTGPYIENSGEALEMAAKGAGLVRVETPEAFQEELEKLMTDTAYREQLSHKAQNYLLERRGAARRYAEVLLNRAK